MGVPYDDGDQLTGVRLIQLTVPTGKRDPILDVLTKEKIDYVVSNEIGENDYDAIVEFPLPSNAVEPVLDALREAGLPDDEYIIVLDAETVNSRRFEALVERYEADEETKDRISREEILTRATELAPGIPTYVIMIIVSAVVATAGVLLDSAAVVVGSMVIAPLIGPAMATSVGTVLEDRELFLRGTKLQTVGFVLAVTAATAFAVFIKSINLVTLDPSEVVVIDQVRERLVPDFLSLAVALGAGTAGAYSLSTGVSTALVGVMIAVALVPPIAVIGIGIAWWLPTVVIGSTILVLVNFASINLAAIAVLWYKGFRPRQLFRENEARTATLRRLSILIVAIVVLSAFLGATTYSSYQLANSEEEIRNDIQSVLSEPRYGTFSLISVSIQTEGYLLTRHPEHVIITLGRPPGEQYAGLVDTLTASLKADNEFVVEVRFVEVATG